MTRIQLLLVRAFSALLLVTLPLAAQAEKPKRVKFVAPEGFGAHRWGDLRSKFDRLPETPVGVAAAWMSPREKRTDITCVPLGAPGPTMSGFAGGCDFHATLLRLRKAYEGGGFYVLSEYSIEGQGFRFGDVDPVVLHPVNYQFCANWSETKKEVPPDFDSMNKFCGMRLRFESETREQLRGLPADHVTNYDRVLEKLLASYGEPYRYARRGRVVIETLEGDSSDAGDRRFSVWRWCPAKDRFHTECPASVVLALDPATGIGTVLYSTPLLWEFAYAREHNGYAGDPLYRMLHARK